MKKPRAVPVRASIHIPPSVRARLDAAARRYEKFSGHKAELVEKVPFPENPKAALVIGELIEVGYVTVRDGKREHYRHTFRAKSRPLLVTSFDGKQLFILGGEYSFTERGIEDE